MPEKRKPAPLSLQYVDLSLRSFAVWWVILLSVHLVTCGYNAAFALFYYKLRYTYLYRCLEYSGIGMPAKDHSVIAHANTSMALMHAGCALLMVVGSIWRRELAFSPLAPDNGESFTKSKGLRGIAPDRNDEGRFGSRISSMRYKSVRVYSHVWGRKGLMGVNGRNFHSILIARELLETVLQTIQAYRMSWYLPRMFFNRFYLVLLVLNCWSSVFIYSLLFKRDEARKRFASLVSDCILDLVSCIGVPLIVVLSYVGDYDSQLTGFPLTLWYDDAWSAGVLNEFQMVLVVSWSALISRTVFSVGLIATTTSLKELLRKSPGGRKQHAGNPILPVTDLNRAGPKLIDVSHSYSQTGLCSHRNHSLLCCAHLIFGVWGVVVLAMHLQASIQPQLPQCALQVHPWAMTEPACYLAITDCHRLGISGKKDEVAAKWNEFDRSTVVTLAIRHCPELEVPDTISDFHLTTGIKLYNSTVMEWGSSAAVTNTNHPALIWLYFVRVHLPDGRLPEGIMSADYPANLYDVEFTYTNVKELPDDLDTKWLVGTTVYFEYSELTSIPPVLLRLDLYSISLTGSPIAELPSELFEVPDMVYMYMGSIAIQELPPNVTNFSPVLSYIFFTDTNVSYFWSWIDPLVTRTLERSRAPLLMGGSAYCSDFQKITSGETGKFSAPPSDDYSTALMDPSEARRDIILHTVNCDLSNAGPVYPIEFEDSVSGLK